MNNSTIAGNSASEGGGIYSAGTVILKNTVVANSTTGSNCYGTVTDGGGTSAIPISPVPASTPIPYSAPCRSTVARLRRWRSGPDRTAIDAADDAICAADPVNDLDQRGVTRPKGLHCDIGAVEQILEPQELSA